MDLETKVISVCALLRLLHLSCPVCDHEKMPYCLKVKTFRLVAYAAVALSVLSVLAVCITLPLVYKYVSHVKHSLNGEINFCRVSR